ncbi:protein CC2D2B [Sphaerodactylus townsendi]|uniref:protein CC2D2B n=1 Tax=Sphaerodactylus townsendi TaxID=933632 RepID=UPI0020260FB8|nr:protein CC2D2B [Sphaerodactylus townsendi]
MESDTDKPSKKEIHKHKPVKKISVPKGSSKIKQTQDDMYSERILTDEILDPNPHGAVGDVEKQSILTEELRERVRGRLRSCKVESSAHLEGSSSFSERLKQLRKKSCAKYGNQTIQEETSSEKHRFDTKEYQENLEVIMETQNETCVDEGFTFFTSSFEELSKVKETDQESEKNSLKDDPQSLCDLNKEVLLLDQVKEILMPELLEVKPPEYEWSILDKKKQSESLFVPSSSPVVQSSQLPSNMLPRLLEDEGFYIPKKPFVPSKTYHKMENRLLQQAEGKSWFEESGKIISLPSPIKWSSSCRVFFSADTQLKTMYRKLRALVNATKVAESNLEASQLSTKTLEDYRSQIRNTKKLHDIERQRDSSLKQNMLKVWKQIKSARQQQGFTSTTIKLQFQKITKNFESDEYTPKVAEQEIRQEKEENDIKSSNKILTWKMNKGCLDPTPFLSSADSKEINEPLFIPYLTFTTEITPSYMCPLVEQKRRAKVKTQKYFIKIYYNNKLVSCTSETSFHQDFKVIFQQIFKIQVLNWPEELRLEVFESNKRTTLLAKVYLPPPNTFILKNKDVLDEAEFSCEWQVKPSFGAVGSNVSFFLNENEMEELCLLITGKVMYSLSWATDDRGLPLAPTFQPAHFACNSIQRNIEARKGTAMLWHSDMQKLIDWAKQINIDPNDPECSDLIELIMYAKSQEQSDSICFRLEQLQEEFDFVTAEEIRKCKRFQLLQLRNSGQLDFFPFQQIPLCEKEIPDIVFQEHGGQLKEDVLMTDVDVISVQRNSSACLIRKMRKRITKQIINIRHKYNLSDIVNDFEEIISMSQLRNVIFKLGERRRHLKPQRKERRKIPAQAVSDGDVKLLVRILRAYNIPARKAAATKSEVVHSQDYLVNRMFQSRHLLAGKSPNTADPFTEVAVHPFVEVSFQNTVYQTSTADGSHPCWNEELQVDFISPGRDYTFSGLSKIKDNIYINIFDEFMMENHEVGCPKGCSGHSFLRKSWLGSIMFPFSALLEQSKISGTFQVNMPPVLLGYTWSKTYVPPKEECYRQNLKEYTFLTIFATIEPQLSSAEDNTETDKLTDHEDELLLQKACIFKKTCKALFPKRRIITSIFNNEGRNILVTKYITSLNPPQQLLDMYSTDLNSTADLISRFVSLIPCIPDTVDENNEVDVWITAEHCINLGVGNKEEHAVLLCNYFIYIGKKSWVLMGSSVLEGNVAYVLTQENGEYFLWNPLSGQCYKQFDAFCPLQSIDCLISWENVWFNIQQNNSPMYVSFDISKEGFWKQFLPYNFQHSKTQTVQPEEIFYAPTNESLVEELQNRIEKTLKNKMMEWRSQLPTRWHRQCTNILRQSLPKLELRSRGIATDKEETDLEALLEHYWVTGFPIQMPYQNVRSVIEAVFQTGIHSSEVPNTEFALAVHIYPYPNNILSVWIYLVSLVRHK